MRFLSDPIIHFLAVARHEHVTRAANELGVSQPTVSRNLAKLEELLGSRLFDRQGRGLRLNAAGQILLQYVDRAKAELEDATLAIDEQNESAARTISIGFLGTFGVSLIPALIRSFSAQQARPPRFRLLQGSVPFLRDRLDARDIELCVAAPRFPAANLEWRPLFEEDLFAVVPASSILAQRDGIDLVEFATQPFVVLKPQYGLRTVVEQLCRAAGFEPKIAFEVEEVATLRGLVGAGVGVTIAPRPVLETTALTVDLPITSPHAHRVVGLMWRRDRRMSREASLFRNHVLNSNHGAMWTSFATAPDQPNAQDE